MVLAGLTHLLQDHYPQADIRKVDLWGELLRLLKNWPSGHLLILDLSQNHPSDLSNTRNLVRNLPLASVIVIRREIDRATVRRWLALGIGAYLSIDVLPRELFSAVEEVKAGHRYLSGKIQQTLSFESLALHRKDCRGPLTRRERQVLTLIIAEKTTQEIADDLCISHRTAETHRLNIIRKLGVKNTAGIVREAILHGLTG